jgi:flagellar motor protein MotB
LRQRRKIEEGAPKAPAYIVTFSTLITLLLSFFIVLLSMGTTQDNTLFDRGYQGGFLESFKRGFGIRQTFDFKSLGNK